MVNNGRMTSLQNAIESIDILVEKTQINKYIEKRKTETEWFTRSFVCVHHQHTDFSMASLCSFPVLLFVTELRCFLNVLLSLHSGRFLFAAYAYFLSFVTSNRSSECAKQCRKSNNGNKSTSCKKKKKRARARWIKIANRNAERWKTFDIKMACMFYAFNNSAFLYYLSTSFFFCSLAIDVAGLILLHISIVIMIITFINKITWW